MVSPPEYDGSHLSGTLRYGVPSHESLKRPGPGAVIVARMEERCRWGPGLGR
jgi:hypothetical protein